MIAAMKMTDLVRAHMSPPAGMVFHASIESVRNDGSLLGYWSAIERDLRAGARDYLAEISALADESAAVWFGHACYGGGGARFAPADASFRHGYAEIGA